MHPEKLEIINVRHLLSLLAGGLLGALVGYWYPNFYGNSDDAVARVFAAEYALAGATLGFAVSNYLAFRERVFKRIRERSQE